ncbi:uncharacterized protein A1O9_12958 [Exophiala aquamarina CBS 119918]|uniref:Uncharacterized protein n=1 Tax=Exophiala aquamarina CBS 119918 TaxID=1182545 RepID=A0A072NTK5_9EURO|nr:uncharacterized protein A1O9_12958 [Exophiala aquamarina CBS 119918]KEF50981.1 hypothetical protein A1O9_12958 [Exophiala aquamarina CBS 119918]
MQFLALVSLLSGQALAASVHRNLGHNVYHRDSGGYINRTAAITDADVHKLSALGVASVGVNSFSPNGAAWLGKDGPYRNEFLNVADEDLILVIWGPAGSWINVKQPTLTASLPAGTSLWVSFVNGASGAWVAIYADTRLVNGQASNTWGEFTFGAEGVVDVSREVNMDGHPMSIAGPACTTDMDTCVFLCTTGTACTTDYVLHNCENGSQPGARYGIHEGAPSGGCGGMGASATLHTVLS